MTKWLAGAAVLPLIATTAAHAQIKGFASADATSAARTRDLNFRLSQQNDNNHPASLVSGMFAQQNVAAHAFLGVGLANMYGRRKKGEFRIDDPPVRTRNPAVTFVVKF